MRTKTLCMTRSEPTNIRFRLSIAIGVDRPTAAILWKEDHVGCQHDWIILASSSLTTERMTKTPPQAQKWMNSYRLCHWRRRERQRRRRRRKLNEYILSLSSTMKRMTKTPPRAQQWLNHIGFVIIDGGANDKDAAAGAMTAAGGGRHTGRRYRYNVPCACIQGLRLVMQSMWSPGRWVHWTTTSNEPKTMKSMKGMKEKYDCYVIDVWRSNMIVNL